MCFKNRLKELRLQSGLNQKELSEKIGIAPSTISMYERGEREPSFEILETLCDYFNVDVNYMLGKTNELTSIQIDGDKNSTSKALRINVYGYVPAGVPVDAIEDIIDWEEVPADWAKGGKEYIALEVRGDSMYPKYLEKDRIIIERSPDCNSGDDCVVYVNGYESTLKTVIKNCDGSITLKPYNTSYSPRTYSQKNADDFVEIFGIVREIRRKP